MMIQYLNGSAMVYNQVFEFIFSCQLILTRFLWFQFSGYLIKYHMLERFPIAPTKGNLAKHGDVQGNILKPRLPN